MVTIGGKPCIDPLLLAQICDDASPPIPTEPWLGLANSYRCPVGEEPGTGSFLLDRATLDSLALTGYLDAVFADDAGRKVTVQKLTVTAAQSVTPGMDGDGGAAYFVTAADKRWHFARVPIDKAYNVQSADGTGYLAGTLDAGVAWTWATMASSVWTAMSAVFSEIGSYPGLPFSPDGTPENFDFYGSTAWHALHVILARLACTTRYDPVLDTLAILQLGIADTAGDAAATANKPERVWDIGAVDPVRGWRPEKVRVLFRRRPRPTAGESWFYGETITLAATVGTVAGTTVDLMDDMNALGATGAPTNAAAILTRATERAADWVRQRSVYGKPLHAVYRDARPDVRFISGRTAGEWAVEDRAAVLTSVGDGPDGPPPEYVDTWPTAGGTMLWVRITAIPGADPGPYSGTLGHIDATGDWQDDSPLVTLTTLYRAPSNQVPPRIPVGQVVLAVADSQAPGKYKMTPWGGYFRYKDKVFIGAACDANNRIVNIYKNRYRGARELCDSPAPPG